MKKPRTLIFSTFVFLSLSTLAACGGSPAPEPTYTVRWLNYNGEVLEVDNEVKKGEKPSYDGEIPSRNDPSGQYTYVFTGWNPEVIPVESDADYYATFASSVNTYTITWVVDGVETTEIYQYGEYPSFKGSLDKPGDDQYEYEFTGWSPSIRVVDGDETYTALYRQDVKEYQVTFVVEGREDIVISVPYGSMPMFPSGPDTIYDYETGQYVPYIAPDQECDHAFIGWQPALTQVTGNATYTAQFNTEITQYIVTFYDYNGDVLQRSLYPYGEVPEYSGATPSKPSTEQYDYSFKGWYPNISTVYGEQEYYPQFDNTLRKYTVTWVIDGVEETEEFEYGEYPYYHHSYQNPTKESTVDTEYTFTGWSPSLNYIYGDITYTAQFSSSTRKYPITFVFADGSEAVYQLPYGSTIQNYGRNILTEDKAYIPDGYEEELQIVTGPATYHVAYEVISRQSYDVLDYDSGGHVSIKYGAKLDFDLLEVPSFGYFGGSFNGQLSSSVSISSNTIKEIRLSDKIAYVSNLYRWNHIEKINVPENTLAISSNYYSSGLTGLNMVFGDASKIECNEYGGLLYLGSNSNPYHLLVDIKDRSLGRYTVHEDCKSINDFALYYNGYMDSLTIHRGVKYFGSCAFGDPDNQLHISMVDYRGDLYDYLSIEAGLPMTTSGYQTPTVFCDRLLINNKQPEYLVIPNEFTRVRAEAFRCVKSIISVEFPDSVNWIGNTAFWFCENLMSVKMSKNVDQITKACFGGTKLKEIELPEGLRLIESNAFYNTLLTKIVIPSTLQTIYSGAFDNCYLLRSIVNYSSYINPVIGDYSYGNLAKYAVEVVNDMSSSNVTRTSSGFVIYNDTVLVSYNGYSSPVIPSNITEIGDYAFAYLTYLTSVIIPDSVTKIGKYAFAGCTKLERVDINKTSNLTSIGDYAFRECTSLSQIYLPDSITSIGREAFCLSFMTSVVLPNNADLTVSDYAFAGCKCLYQLTIPEYVTNDLPYHLMSSCRNVHVVNLSSLEITDYSFDVEGMVVHTVNGQYGDIKNGLIFSGSGENRQVIGYTMKLTSYTIPDDVYQIGQSVFENNQTVQSIYLGKNCKKISYYAFKNCSNLKEVGNLSVVTKLNSGAFENCTSLKSATFGDGLTTLPAYAFEQCTNLESVTLSDNTTSIGSLAFYKCYHLKNVVMNKVTTIESEAFKYCVSFKNLQLSDDFQDMGSDAFTGSGVEFKKYDNAYYLGTSSNEYYYLYQSLNKNISSVELHPDCKIIFSYAFRENRQLTSITFNEGLIKIGAYAFESCQELKDIQFPDSLQAIGNYAFFGDPLTKLVISDNVTTIGDCAFNSCYNLVSVTVGASVTSIGGYAFFSDYRLVEVINKSSLDINVGDGTKNGGIANYAKQVITDESQSKLQMLGDFLVYVDGDDCIAIDYLGSHEYLDIISVPSEITELNDYCFYDYYIYTIVIVNTSLKIDNTKNGVDYIQIFFLGTPEQWAAMSISSSDSMSYTSYKYFYSEDEPVDTEYTYWHYVDGVPTLW